ncbi:MAG: CehA/McbA family metallohydrolase [Limnochordaceae bacterium]|nr:CehA/McbA family metallohydrolase [Limnochordaceae bacterium]
MRSSLGVARPALAGRVLGGILAAATALAGGLPPAGAAGAGCEAPEGEAGGLCVFFGDLHAHTSYSDGELRPRDAYFYAWRVGKLDFLGLSDHAYSLNGRPEHVDDLLRAARQAQRPGEFVALPGAEWTQSTQGHINVFTWEGFPDRERQPVYPELYRWLESHVVLFAQFNHPGFDIQQNWDAFRYDPRADRVIELLEVGNGPFAHNTRYEGSYRLALDQGWRVGAANNSDVHRAEWGTATPSRTAVWARSLTESDLVEAIRSRRTYATEDPDARLIFRSGAAWMGEVLPLASRVPLRVALWDPDAGDGFASVQVIGNGGQVVREMALEGARRADLRFSVELGRGDAWFYVRAVQQDGDLLVSEPHLVRAPFGGARRGAGAARHAVCRGAGIPGQGGADQRSGAGPAGAGALELPGVAERPGRSRDPTHGDRTGGDGVAAGSPGAPGAGAGARHPWRRAP